MNTESSVPRHPMDKRNASIDLHLFRAITLMAVVFFVVLLIRWFETFSIPVPPSPLPVIVEVLGEVKEPGIHLLEVADPATPVTVRNAIEAAGGFSKDQSQPIPSVFDTQEVQNGQRIRVTQRQLPDLPEIRVELMDAASRLTLGMKLDLNEAPEEELSLIPQMKPEFAFQIVRRRAQKPWQELRELQEISGIGPKTVEKWKEYLEVTSRD